MTVFPTASHLVSWSRWSPQVKQSAGNRKGSNATGRGNPYLGAALGEAAASAGRTQSFPGARYRRLSRRRGKAKALVAVGNTQLKVCHALLSHPGTRYEDLGPDYNERQASTRRQIAHHVGKLGALGFEVTLCRIPEPEPDPGQANSS